jgi:co-chaperonin GroES (HSP10)
MLKEINSKDNKVKIRDLNQKKYKIELIEDQEQNTNNDIYIKGTHRNCLSEGKNLYSNKTQNLKLTQNEYNSVQKDKNIINERMKDYNINNKNEEYILEKYDIIDEKNIGDLNWILLRKKNGNNNNYDDYVWAEKKIYKK